MPSLIFNNNYIDADLLPDWNYSSQQTAFPVTNTFAGERRSKPWRSNGYWVVTASNNEIVFEESASSPEYYTATITVGEYTTTQAFLDEVAAALNAAIYSFDGSIGPSGTMSVTRDATTRKITVTSTQSFEPDWLLSSAGDLLGFGSTAASGDFATTKTADEARIHTSEWIEFDLGISSSPQSFALIGNRNAAIQLSPSATITIMGNPTNTWTSPAYSQVLTYDDNIIYTINTDGLHTSALRYWRLEIIDKANTNGYVEIGALLLGTCFIPTRGRVQWPFSGRHVDRSDLVTSEGGQTLARRRQKTEEFSISWAGLTVSEKEELDALFDEVGITDPFFISIDPDAANSSSGGYYFRYVRFISEPSYQLASPQNYSVGMELREDL